MNFSDEGEIMLVVKYLERQAHPSPEIGRYEGDGVGRWVGSPELDSFERRGCKRVLIRRWQPVWSCHIADKPN